MELLNSYQMNLRAALVPEVTLAPMREWQMRLCQSASPDITVEKVQTQQPQMVLITLVNENQNIDSFGTHMILIDFNQLI